MTGPPARKSVWAALLAVYLVWGSTYLGIAYAIRTMPPLLMCGVRFLLASGLLYAFARRRGDRAADPIGRRQWLAALLTGAPLLLVGNGTVAWAETSIQTGTAALIVASMPLWLALLDRLVFGARLSRSAVGGLVLGFAGVGLLVAPGGSGHTHLPAALALVGSSFCWAAGSLYSRRAPLPKRPLVGASMQMLVGGVLLCLAGLAKGEAGQVHLSQLSAESIGGLLYLVLIGSLVGFTCYVWLLRKAPTSLVGTYAYVNPVVAVLLGLVFLGESPSWRTLAGGAIIVASVALIVRAPSARLERQVAAVPVRAR